MSFADTPTMLIKNACIDGQAVDLRIDHIHQQPVQRLGDARRRVHAASPRVQALAA